MNEKELEELKQILEESESEQTLDPNEALSIIAQRFVESFREDDLLVTLSELTNEEIVAIARLYPVVSTLEKHYQIQTPLGNFVRWILLGRISKYRRGRKEVLQLVGKLTGSETELTNRGLLKRLFGKE